MCVCLIVSPSVTLPLQRASLPRVDVEHELTNHVAQRVGGVVPQFDFLNNLANILLNKVSYVYVCRIVSPSASLPCVNVEH